MTESTEHPSSLSYSLSYASRAADSAWGTYLSQVDRVAPYLGTLGRWTETLKRPKRTLIVDIPVEMDDGSVRHFEGFRVQHNLSRGPGKGGVRYHPAVCLEEVMALASSGLFVVRYPDHPLTHELRRLAALLSAEA